MDLSAGITIAQVFNSSELYKIAPNNEIRNIEDTLVTLMEQIQS